MDDPTEDAMLLAQTTTVTQHAQAYSILLPTWTCLAASITLVLIPTLVLWLASGRSPPRDPHE
jgi:hypothetical protein